MSWSGDQSPRPKNSPDWHQRRGQYGNFRSPYPSPRNGQDFGGPSPVKNFGWRNNGGYNRFQNDRFHYSPGGNRRGGGRYHRGRGGANFRGSGDPADISLYVNPSMLSDPWKELEENLGLKLATKIRHSCELTTDTSLSSSVSTSLNASATDETKENVTEESVVLSDDSADNIVVTEKNLISDKPTKSDVPNPDPPSS